MLGLGDRGAGPRPRHAGCLPSAPVVDAGPNRGDDGKARVVAIAAHGATQRVDDVGRQ